jgi:hypothetical protein
MRAQFDIFDVDFEEWVVPAGVRDFPDEAAVRIRAGNAAPRTDLPPSMPGVPPAASATAAAAAAEAEAAAAAAAAMSEGVPPLASLTPTAAVGGGGYSVAAMATAPPPVVQSVDLGSTGASTGQPLAGLNGGGDGPLGIFSPRPSRQRPAHLPATHEDGGSKDGDDEDSDEAMARRFFEATTGGSVETAPAPSMLDRPQTFDLAGASDWAGDAGQAQQQKPGRLNRIKRSASISVV